MSDEFSRQLSKRHKETGQLNSTGKAFMVILSILWIGVMLFIAVNR